MILSVFPVFRADLVRKARITEVEAMKSKSKSGMKTVLCGFSLAVMLSATTGCQVDIGGQIFPSPYYNQDDVQYFSAGSEFKLQREAAQQKAYQADAQAQGRGP